MDTSSHTTASATTSAATPALEVNALNKTYKNGHTALKEVNFKVEHGDFFALLGPNGAGKSTIIGIITSLINKSSGKVFVHGYDLDQQAEEAKACLGTVPQEFSFNSFEPVMEILVNQAGYYGVPYKLACQRAEDSLRRLGLWEKHAEEARNLSGGMKRRLMIARAMVHRPRLLILDEPTAGVDIEVRRMVWRFLTELNEQGITIILTTHYLEEAERLCRNIAIISDGEIIADTDMRSLLDRKESESFTLYLEQPLSAPPTIANAQTYLINDSSLELIVTSSDDLVDALSALRAQGIRFSGMRNTTNRLEELFLQLVGSDDAA